MAGLLLERPPLGPTVLAQLRGVGEEPSHRGLDPRTRDRPNDADPVDDHCYEVIASETSSADFEIAFCSAS